MKKLWITFLLFSLINSAIALNVNIPVSTNYSLIPTVNSSDFWDDLDTPADITYDDISGGDVEALGYTGFFNFIIGVVGGLAIDGDPWFLSDASLDIENNLTVYNNTFIGGFLNPLVTLTSDIGSGAKRWRWLYVQNISSENIDTFSLHISENITLANGGKVWDNSTCTFISSPDGSNIQEVCNA